MNLEGMGKEHFESDEIENPKCKARNTKQSQNSNDKN